MSEPSVTQLIGGFVWISLLGLGLLAWMLWFLSQLHKTLKDVQDQLGRIHTSLMNINDDTRRLAHAVPESEAVTKAVAAVREALNRE
jgi:hypothetical protein